MKTTLTSPLLVQGTPSGSGGISVLYLIASEVVLEEWAQFCFSPQPFSSLERPSRVYFSFFGDSTAPIDQVLWTLLSSEESIFRLPTLEINLHGGPQIIESAKRYLQQKGVLEVSMQEALLRTLGKIEGLAYRYLLAAKSSFACNCFLQQACGALRQRLEKILKKLEQSHLKEAIHDLEALRATASFGTTLHIPHSFILSGATNVGKSSLFNRLLGEERAIVSPQAGTTIDVVQAERLLNGFPILLMDSAGFSEAPSFLEKLGLEKTQKHLQEAVPIWVFDATKPETFPSLFLSSCIYVANKSDLSQAPLPPEILAVSALSGEGIAGLEAQMARFLPATVSIEEGFLFDSEHISFFTQLSNDLTQQQFTKAIEQLRHFLSMEPPDLRISV